MRLTKRSNEVLTITLVASGTITVTVPDGANVYEFVRTIAAVQCGVWDLTANIFYPIYAIASIAYVAA
jgi:hypothetical protein